MTDNNQKIGLLTIGLLHARLKKVMTEKLDSIGFSQDTYDLNSIISPAQIRNILIRQEYYEQRQDGVKAERMYHILADKYNLTYKSVMSIIHRKR